MKNSCILSLVLICLVSVTSEAQKIHSYMKPMGSLADAAKGNFSSSEAGFSIALPKQIGGFSGVAGIEYNWRLTEGFFVAGTVDRATDVENSTELLSKETTSLANATYIEFTRSYFVAPVQPIKVEPQGIEFAGHKGYEIRLTLPEAVCLIRIIWDKGRAYKVAALLAGSQQKFESDAKKVLDSLTIHPRVDTDKKIQKLIDENTPESLPQTPAAKRLTSDAQDEDLKGKVKTILQFEQFIQGKKAGTPKRNDVDTFYNEEGNLVKRVIYDDTSGLPSEVEVFGYIDNNRVSRELSVRSESSPPPMTVGVPSRSKKRDSRFHSRYGYKYNAAGKIIEMTIYGNDGSVWIRTVYKRSDNKVEEIRYDEAGKVNSRSIVTIDEKGNEIEHRSDNVPLPGSGEILNYKYDEFDAQGNWVKRTVTFSRTIEGVSAVNWIQIETRMITYY